MKDLAVHDGLVVNFKSHMDYDLLAKLEDQLQVFEVTSAKWAGHYLSMAVRNQGAGPEGTLLDAVRCALRIHFKMK